MVSVHLNWISKSKKREIKKCYTKLTISSYQTLLNEEDSNWRRLTSNIPNIIVTMKLLRRSRERSLTCKILTSLRSTFDVGTLNFWALKKQLSKFYLNVPTYLGTFIGNFCHFCSNFLLKFFLSRHRLVLW